MRELPSRRKGVPLVKAVGLGVFVGTMIALVQAHAQVPPTGEGTHQGYVCNPKTGCETWRYSGGAQKGCGEGIWCQGTKNGATFPSCVTQTGSQFTDGKSIGYVGCNGICMGVMGGVCTFEVPFCGVN
jgi:hypothetical protein